MKHTSLCIALLAAATALPALAQDNVFKLGLTRYDTNAKTSNLGGIGLPAGADVSVGDATTVIFVGERMVTPNVGVELVIGVPPKIKASGAGSVAFLGEVLEARNAAPTVLVNWHFGQAGDTWRPYAGLGVNYTRFVGIKSPYGWDVSLSDSWGLAGQVGVDYAINARWGLFASVAAVKVKSDLVAVGANVIQATIDFRPVVWSAGMSYRF